MYDILLYSKFIISSTSFFIFYFIKKFDKKYTNKNPKHKHIIKNGIKYLNLNIFGINFSSYLLHYSGRFFKILQT